MVLICSNMSRFQFFIFMPNDIMSIFAEKVDPCKKSQSKLNIIGENGVPEGQRNFCKLFPELQSLVHFYKRYLKKPQPRDIRSIDLFGLFQVVQLNTKYLKIGISIPPPVQKPSGHTLTPPPVPRPPLIDIQTRQQQTLVGC